MEDLKYIGKRIKEIRKRNKISQEKLRSTAIERLPSLPDAIKNRMLLKIIKSSLKELIPNLLKS